MSTASTGAGTGAGVVAEWVIVCGVCEIEFVDFTDPGEAVYFAGVHNDLHHAHSCVAFVVPLHHTPSSTSTGVGPCEGLWGVA